MSTNVQRIIAAPRPLFNDDRSTGMPTNPDPKNKADNATLHARWDALARLGIGDLAAHWLLSNLSESQIRAFLAACDKGDPATEGVAARAARARAAEVAAIKSTANAVCAALRASGKSHAAAKKAPHALSERELQKCRARGVDPAKYAAVKQASFGGTT